MLLVTNIFRIGFLLGVSLVVIYQVFPSVWWRYLSAWYILTMVFALGLTWSKSSKEKGILQRRQG